MMHGCRGNETSRHPSPTLAGALLLGLIAGPAHAHLLGDESHHGASVPRYDRAIAPPRRLALRSEWAIDEMIVAHRGLGAIRLVGAQPAAAPAPKAVASMLELFKPFAPQVATRWDDRYLYVESDGMPDHRMMVGITAWQQQVPLPQPYVGDNAWRIPLHPVAADTPRSARTGFFRGAIGLAVNGVPIFNPIKNDGRTDTFQAGELDEFGGHAGRADDYHYHIAPLHLQKLVGERKPVAFALDGYPLYGLVEPDGAPLRPLDALNGHADGTGGYHYHASKAYPYVNGGFHGQITERGGQVDPQPSGAPWRQALPPLRGARVTAFTKDERGGYTLQFRLDNETWTVKYELQPDGAFRFTHFDPDGLSEAFTYRRSTIRRPGG